MDVDIKGCARCHGDHAKLDFEPLSNPTDKFAFWALCPETHQPLLLAKVVRCQCGSSELPLSNVNDQTQVLLRAGEAWTISQPDDWQGPWPPDEGTEIKLAPEVRAKLIRHYFGGGKACAAAQ